jgi:hypothetical protein
MSTRTIGIDLSAAPERTAACVVNWEAQRAHVVTLILGLTDAQLVELVAEHRPSKVGIDAPFGWPTPFVEAVSSYTSAGAWPGSDRSPLTLRTTDRVVWAEAGGRPPLSVSSDRIAACAMRCAWLLSRWAEEQPLDRTGAGLFVEVYPAPALRRWGLATGSYKGKRETEVEVRKTLVEALSRECSGWFDLDNETLTTLYASDDALDAVVCAVIARVVGAELAPPIPAEHLEVARLEGWIHLPPQEPLRELGPRLATSSGE